MTATLVGVACGALLVAGLQRGRPELLAVSVALACAVAGHLGGLPHGDALGLVALLALWPARGAR